MKTIKCFTTLDKDVSENIKRLIHSGHFFEIIGNNGYYMLYDDTIYDLYEEEKLDFVDCISEYAKREYDEYMLKHCLNTFIPLKDALIEFVKFLKDNQVTEKESIIIGVIW